MKKILRQMIVFILSITLFITIKDNSVLAVNNLENINYKRITIDDGLSQSAAKVVYQDSLGYIWIGTTDGLNKYNGHQFEIFRSGENQSESLSGNNITVIKEDGKNNIWIGTTTGLNKINLKTNKITRYLPNENGCNISSYDIRDILINKSGDVLVATKDGINIYKEQSDNFKRIYNSNKEKTSLSSQEVNSIVEDDNGYYWAGTKDGLNKISKDTNEIEKYYLDENDKNSLSFNYINTLYVDDMNNLWIGTNFGGLNKLNLETKNFERFNPTYDFDSLSGFAVRDIIKDSRGEMWIATEGGLSKLDITNNTIKRYMNNPYDTKSIINNDILSLFEDESGAIWVGTYNGISVFYPENIFKIYNHDIRDENSITNNSISSIYEDKDGILWVGTVNDGLNIIDRTNNQVKRIQHKKGSNIEITNNLIREIVGLENEIWIATQDGLHKYDKDTNSMSYYFEEDGLVNNDIRSVFIDSEGTLWIGTRGGLCSFDRDSTFKNYTELLSTAGIKEKKINHITEDDDGVIWIASGYDGGLIRFDKDINTFKNYNDFSESENAKQFDKIESVTCDDNGVMWIATDNGLIKFNKYTEKYYRYTVEDGLSNNYIYGVLLDEVGNLWISTNNGLSKFYPNSETFINYYDTDGIQGNEFNQYSYYKSGSGEMFFGGMDGLTSFYSKDIQDKEFVPSVIIDQAVSNGSTLNVTENIILNYTDKHIQFEFFMPDYRDTKRIQYSYKLSGVNNEWVTANNRNYVNYTNLRPGNYTFQVKGRNSSGIWSEPMSIDIKVKYPPWETPIAYIIYVVIIVGIMYFMWNRVKILNKLVDQRTYELNNKLEENEGLYTKLLQIEKSKNNYFVNLSHELRTPLNIIVSVQSLMMELNKKEEHIPKEKVNYYLESLKTNSNRLLNLINNIINTSKIEAGQYQLNIGSFDIVNLVEETVLSTKELAEGKGVDLIIDPYIEEKIIQCDKVEIEKCILNLLSNAIKFTPTSGKIEVIVDDLQDKVKISVKDTGSGIDLKYQESVFNRFDQAYKDSVEEYGGSGLGLTFTRQLVELHGGRIWVESELCQGSEFIIVLPVKSKE